MLWLLVLRFISDRISPTLKQIPGYQGDSSVESIFLIGASYHIGFRNFEFLMEKAGNWETFQKNLQNSGWVLKTINDRVDNINSSRLAKFQEANSKYNDEVKLAKKEKRKPKLSKPLYPDLMNRTTRASAEEFVNYRISARNCLESGVGVGPVVAGTNRTRPVCIPSAKVPQQKRGGKK